ncbi:MAG TPA: methyltransferase domain-containing protein, partial [Gemmatimonadales bacterium]|nr:methyltransferase domain-containing protein [Gemmatimonadales bacterium]
VRWAARRGVTLRPLAIDRIPTAARIASMAGVPAIAGCGGALPLRDRSVDLVLVSQVAHHLDTDSILALFASCSRVARRGVVISDLRPSVLFGQGFRLAGRALRLHVTTINDGVTSLARGFTPARLAALATAAARGDRSGTVQVAARPLSRVVAWWRTDR